jgi:hypothetical protein
MIVLSGAHPGYKADPSAPLFQTIDDILLTRGEGRVDDHEWAKRIFGLDDGTTLAGYIIEKLRSLALTESSEVKYAACQLLWSYDNPPISEDLRERAHDSITSAGCTCDADRFGRVVCH